MAKKARAMGTADPIDILFGRMLNEFARATIETATSDAADPIDAFFTNYPGFDYDASKEVWSEYRRMVQHFGWSSKSQEEQTGYAAFRHALVEQFGHMFGTSDSKLETLQHLCEKLDVTPVPGSITACKKAIKKVHVNIVDFIDSERTGLPLHKFGSARLLAIYTHKTGKIFPKVNAKQTTLLRFLLRRIYN